MGLRTRALTAVALSAAAAATVAFPPRGADQPDPTIELVAKPPTPAGGRPSLVNSRNGRAILAVAAMAPGESRSGSVTLRNAGGAPAHVTLSQRDLVAPADVAGRSLTDVLHLRVTDRTTGLALYAGPVHLLARTGVCGSARTRAATCPPWRGGETHDVEFVVTMRDAGNAYAGRRLTVTYDWVASEPRSGA